MPNSPDTPNLVDLQEITLFRDLHSNGTKLILPPGPHDMNDLSVKGFAYRLNPQTRTFERFLTEKLGNDTVSSLNIPWGRAAILFSDAMLEGERLFLPDGFHNLTDYQGPSPGGTWNDVLSSITIFNTHEEAVFFEDINYGGRWSGYQQGVHTRNRPSGLISSCFLSAGILAGVSFSESGLFPAAIHTGATPFVGPAENDRIQGIHIFKNQAYGAGQSAQVRRDEVNNSEVITVSHGPAYSECLIWTQPPQANAAYRQIMRITLDSAGNGRNTKSIDARDALWGYSRRYALFVGTSEFTEF